MSATTTRAARKQQWSGYRVVSVDVETTGLTPDDRVLSVALCEAVEGRIQNVVAQLIDPGLEFLGAYEIHGLTNETLAAGEAVPFAEFASTLTRWLTPRNDELVVLVGHNVIFDALILNYEYERLTPRGTQALPPVILLNTKTLAAKLGVKGTTLAELMTSLEMTAHDEHTAISDATNALEVVLRLADKLAQEHPDTGIAELFEEFDRTLQLTRTGRVKHTKPREPLEPEHETSHLSDMTRKASREKALAVCVAHRCPEIVSRVFDSIQTRQDAASVATWLTAQLARDDLDRATRGRLLGGLGVAVGRTGNGDAIRKAYDRLTPQLAAWGPCQPGDQCDRCADPENKRTCRYLSIRYALIRSYLGVPALPGSDDDIELDADAIDTAVTTRATAFLPYIPGARRERGRPKEGWFHVLLKAGDPDAAGYGAALVARTGSRSRTPGWERQVLAYAWDRGCRNARLADHYSAIVLADGSPDPTRPHLREAYDICQAGLTALGGAPTYDGDRLALRRTQIENRWASMEKAEQKAKEAEERSKAWKEKYPDRAPTVTRNPRPPRVSRFQLPDLTI